MKTINLFLIKRWCRNKIYSIRCFFNPRHNTLRQSIPREWSDSVELIRIVNFTIVTEFVEEEHGGFNRVIEQYDLLKKHSDLLQDQVLKEKNYMDNCGSLTYGGDNNWLEFYKWLIDTYIYIRIQRPMILERVERFYETADLPKTLDDINSGKYPYKETYKELNEIEDELKEKDTKYLLDIIKKREYFWT